jgi:hypothetical protein
MRVADDTDRRNNRPWVGMGHSRQCLPHIHGAGPSPNSSPHVLAHTPAMPGPRARRRMAAVAAALLLLQMGSGGVAAEEVRVS